jgi:hypothetical protein
VTPATAELQRRSFEIAMQATERALAKGPLEPRKSDLYRLPDGRVVPIHADVARGASLVTFVLESGEVVNALREPPLTVAELNRIARLDPNPSRGDLFAAQLLAEAEDAYRSLPECRNCGEKIKRDDEPWLVTLGLPTWYHPDLVESNCNGVYCCGHEECDSCEGSGSAMDAKDADSPSSACGYCGGSGTSTVAEPFPQPAAREDEELFRCLTCEDTGEIEVQQRNSAGQAFREPWLTRTIACPDCDGAR